MYLAREAADKDGHIHALKGLVHIGGGLDACG